MQRRSAWLQRAARLVRLGITAELRNPALRLAGALAAVGAGVYAWNQGDLPGTTALALSLWLGRAYGIAACLWFGYMAIRDLNEKSGAVIRSKPVDGAEWTLLNWTVGTSVWLILLLLPFAAAAVAQLILSGPISLASFGLAYLRAASAMVAAVTLAFGLSRLLRSPLGGILVLFAWFCAMAGLQYIPSFLQPDYAQNRPLYLGAAALVFALTALIVERFRRGELRRPAGAIVACIALLGLTAAGAARAYRLVPRPSEEGRTLWTEIAMQHVELGKRAPGFWLPDGKGGTVRTADYHGKILLIYLFAPDDVETTRTLPALDRILAQYGSRGVQPIGVCVSPDHGDGWMLARAGGYHFPIGSDLATVHSSAPPESSLTIAYDVQTLPMLIITDRRRQVREMLSEPYYDLETLRQRVEQRLAAEPE
ncbi:MAG TPA: redoxin domain-containing protein [Armatimonadota bacterium]|nr:redoxin domain-containing protein [Armatimonadota bacterium]